MALSNLAMLRTQTVLQQLLEEINFQRAKEMRQMLKDGKPLSPYELNFNQIRIYLSQN